MLNQYSAASEPVLWKLIQYIMWVLILKIFFINDFIPDITTECIYRNAQNNPINFY